MKKILITILVSVFFAMPTTFAALSSAVVWEVRTAGTDTNGGGFKAGATGTDWSQYDNKNASGCSSCGSSTDDLSVTDGVTAGTTTVTSATANFGTTIVGNVIYITGGTGSISANWYEVTGRTNSTTITVDRSTGLTAGTGVTLNIGGALKTLTQAAATTNSVSGNTIYVKNGTYGETLTLNTSAGGFGGYINWIGYGSSRGDNPTGTNRPLIDGASTRANCINVNSKSGNNFFYFRLSGATGDCFTGNVAGGSAGFSYGKISSCGDEAIDASSGYTIYHTEIGSNTGAGRTDTNSGISIYYSFIHDNGSDGVKSDGGSSYFNVFDTNSGVGWYGSSGNSLGSPTLIGNTFYANTSDCYRNSNGSSNPGFRLNINNVCQDSGGDGYEIDNFSGAYLLMDYNQCNNASGTCWKTVAYNGPHDVTSTSGMTDPANQDFTPGANIKGVGVPGTVEGSSTTSYKDIGAVDAQCSGGSGGASSCTFS